MADTQLEEGKPENDSCSHSEPATARKLQSQLKMKQINKTSACSWPFYKKRKACIIATEGANGTEKTDEQTLKTEHW